MSYPIANAHASTAAEITASLRSDVDQGLAQLDVVERRRAYGPNRLSQQARKSVLAVLRHQFTSVIVWLLAGAAALSLFLRDVPEAIAIGVVLLLNGAIGFVAELRAARSMEALLRIAEVRTRVLRNGRPQVIDAREIVPGDIVLLEAGDVVTADLRLVRSSNLQSDESILTGESSPVHKSIEPVAPDASIGDRTSMAFKGAAITQGTGAGIVTATGMATEIGKISALVESAASGKAPLEKRLDRLGHRLVWLTLGLALVTIVAGILRGHDAADMIQTGVALAVAAVPEGLPVVATLCLARGMWRMAARNAVITNLSSVETLGATTAILTDKTGTLTENRMTVVRYLLCEGDISATRSNGQVQFLDVATDGAADVDDRLVWALRIGALCHSHEWGSAPDDDSMTDPMEAALWAVADQAGVPLGLQENFVPVREHAFDPVLRMMATVHQFAPGCVTLVKGAPEAVIARCTSELGADGPRALTDAGRTDWIARNMQAADEGLRLLALARKTSPTETADPYDDLTLVGLVCLLDPLRADVPEAIRASLAAGVKVVVLTGDHANTAATISRQAGLGADGLDVVEGGDLPGIGTDLTDAQMATRLLGADVFARVAPDTKLALVSLYQDNGHIVAMTGDGVNDAPALKQADIGIAMGLRGTQVAREAADMVLKDDAFSTIIAAMRQGRVIYDNIRRFVVYLMSCNVSEVLVVGLAVGLGLPSPLLPLQILFLNLVTDVFPAFALGFGRGDAQIMQRPPRDPSAAVLDRAQWTLIAWLGGFITLATLAAFAIALFRLGLASDAAVTVAFLTLALAQLWNVFNMRAPSSGLWRNEVTANRYVWMALVLCVGLIAFAVAHPAAAGLLGLPSPGPAGLMLAGGMSLLPLILGQTLVTLRGGAAVDRADAGRKPDVTPAA